MKKGAWCAGAVIVGAMVVGCREKQVAAPDAGAPIVKKGPGPTAPGETRVDVAKSKLSLSMIKDRDLKSPVTATMGVRDGAVSLDTGKARLSIDLDTFDSAIPLRNERVRGIFFETSGVGWDTVELSIAKIPDDVLATLRDKKRVSATLDADVKLHGKTVKIALPVDASYMGTTLLVKSAQAVEIKVSDFGLTDNLKHLSSICMHDSIDDVVKVDVALEFPAR